MLPNEAVRIELIYDKQSIDWITLSNDEVTKALQLKKEEYQKKHDEEKAKYLENLSFLQKILYRIFG